MAEWTTPDAVYDKCGETGASIATNTIDDNLETKWLHYAVGYHWIIFDMGETKLITKIRLYQEERLWGGARGLTVYVSDDPEDWGDAVWEGKLNYEGWQESGEFSKSGRYIKLVNLWEANLQYMWEFDAYAEAVAPPVKAKPSSIIPLMRVMDMISVVKPSLE